jgi:hypothetical protein
MRTSTPPPSRSSMAPPAAAPTAPPEPRSRTPLIAALVILLLGCVVGIWALTKDRAGDDASGTNALPITKAPVAPAVGSDPVMGKTDLPPRRVGPGAASDEQDPTPSVKNVKLSIKSKPAHALVKLNGTELGHTPLANDVAPVDNATIEISADGYDTETEKISLATDQTIDVSLNRKGSAVVVRQPPHRDPPQPPRTTKPPGGTGSASPTTSTGSGADLEIRGRR